jgi:hypothetical protein
MNKKSQSKVLPTKEGKQDTKKEFIIEFNINNPQASASEIAEKAKTTKNYVYKVLSESRKPSKDIRGRRGHIFAHGKIFYDWWIAKSQLASIDAPLINPITGLRQLGYKKKGDPVSCQIHPNGHLIIWPRSSSWRIWLTEELSRCGLSKENAQLIVDNAQLNVSIIEAGIKPKDPGFLPKDLYLETEWGAVLVKDDTPEKGVLELKLSIPKMQTYLGIPEIIKKLEVIEQGSITTAQRARAQEALLYMLCNRLQEKGVI